MRVLIDIVIILLEKNLLISREISICKVLLLPIKIFVGFSHKYDKISMLYILLQRISTMNVKKFPVLFLVSLFFSLVLKAGVSFAQGSAVGSAGSKILQEAVETKGFIAVAMAFATENPWVIGVVVVGVFIVISLFSNKG